MAVYRQVHISFWQDPFVLDLTPEEKYFYLYLMTNSKTTQCGIYEIPKRIIEFETGYNRETVDKLISRFVGYGKILYDEETDEIMLLNWIKHNANRSVKVVSRVQKELLEVKSKDLLSRFNRVCILYQYPIDTQTQKEKEKEPEEEKEKTTTAAVNLFKIFEQEFGRMLSPMEIQEIKAMESESGPELATEALRRAVANRVLKTSYIQKILNNWADENLTTLVAVLDYEQAEKKAKSRKQQGQAVRPKTNEFGEDKFAGIYAKG